MLKIGKGKCFPGVKIFLGGSAFSPLSLFASGEQGAWYDPSDLSSMWQDSGATTAAVVGQPVGKILDKSGRGNHAIQATAINRPTLLQDGGGRNYLSFNGTNSVMATAATVDFTGTNKMTVFVGDRVVGTTNQSVVELSLLGTSVGGFGMLFLPGAAPTIRSSITGASANTQMRVTGITADTANAVHTQIYDMLGVDAPSESQIRVNGALPSQLVQSAGYSGGGNFGNYALTLSSSTFPFNGRLYGVIVRGVLTTAPLIASTETYVNSKTGAY